MKAKDVHELTTEELDEKLAETRRELFELRFQSATGGLDNHARMKLAKRDIARLLTVQRERSLETK